MNVSEILNSIVDYDRFIVGVEPGIPGLSNNTATKHVGSIVHDHRLVNSDSIFVALKGNHIDSHAYIEDARSQGAALVIGQNGNEFAREPDLVVGSTRAIIGPLVSSFYGFPSSKMSLVGITGTNGKTTVSYLYSNIVRAAGRHCFTMGTTGILVDGEKEADSQTTPDPIIIQKYFADFLSDGIKDGAIEVSSHALHQFRVLGTYFSAVAFTNFSQDHLDYHESMEEYFSAKMSLFSKIYSHNAVINLDDPRGEEVCSIAKSNGQDVVKVSAINSDADIYVELKNTGLERSQLLIHVRGENEYVEAFELETRLIGDFNFENIAVALGLAKATGCNMEIAIRAMENPESVPGRLERPSIQSDFSVFVDYAHTPDALKRVIATIKPLASRVIVVFGCGGDRDQAKRPIMGQIASELADEVIITNDNPRSEDPIQIATDIEAGAVSKVTTELDRRKAIKMALCLAKPGDAVIVAGKGHETGQIFGDRVEEFSDIKVVEEIMEEVGTN